MSDLTEQEIFDRMAQSLKIAAECCDTLAVSSRKGPTYHRLREHLALIEGCCRQAAAWREDARWLPIGMLMSDCHKRAGEWLRGLKDPLSGQRTPTAKGQLNRAFVMLAENLRAILVGVDMLKTQKTATRGMILPGTPKAERQPGAPVGWRASKGGILLPS
jgi:hypothetical protein